MKYPILVFVGLTALASIAFNAHFGYMIGQHSEWVQGIHNGYLYGAVAAFLDVIKISVPIMLAIICFSSVSMPWKILSSLIGVPLFIGMTAISLSGIFGSVAVDRDTMSASRSGLSDQYQALKVEAQALERTAWADIRPVDEIRAQISSYLTSPGNRWGPTNGCDIASITIPQSRAWCQDYQRLVGQLERAEQVMSYRARLREINSRLAHLPGSIEGDPQARRMGDMLGISPDAYVTALLALFAFLIEFCPSLIPVLIYVYGRAREPIEEIGSDTATDRAYGAQTQVISLDDTRRMAAEAHHKQLRSKEPECPVVSAAQRQRHRGRSEISFPELSETIAHICRERGDPPMTARAIGLRVRELGYDVWQEQTDTGKVTVYGLGGAQSEILKAA